MRNHNSSHRQKLNCMDFDEQSTKSLDNNESSSSTILRTVNELSRTQERILLRKFGIFQSTSTSENKQTKKNDRITVKRVITFSESSKKVKKKRKSTIIKKPQRRRLLPIEKEERIDKHNKKKSHLQKPHYIDSTSTLAFPDNLHDSTPDEEAIMEHDSIATKYGLPYDRIVCACYLKEEIFGVDRINNYHSKPICISQSCFDFEKIYGKCNKASKYSKEARKLEGFETACETFHKVIRKSREIMDEKEFLSAIALLQEQYPNYWKHICEKESVYLLKYEKSKENFSKTRVVLSCIRLLKEQDLLSKHYRVKMKGLKDGMEFNDRLTHNFKIAGTFFKTEYPGFFVYLMKKYKFQEIALKRSEIIRNRLRMILRAGYPAEKLNKLEEKYMRK